MPEFDLQWRSLPQGLLAFNEGRGVPVAGIGHHHYRPWLFPLYTPSGQQVLQEFAFDHPFHNGCFMGWSPVRVNGSDHNFWATPPQRTQHDPMMEHLGRQRLEGDIHLAREGAAIVATMSLAWVAQDGTPLMTEERRFTVRADATLHQVSVESRLQALDSDIALPVTKFAGLGVRLDVRLTQVAGAVFSGDSGHGDAGQLHGRASSFIDIEGKHGSHPFGLRLSSRRSLKWFVRGYGLVLLNPVTEAPLCLRAGEVLVQDITLSAYDGAPPSRHLMPAVG
jgi:hypothetical protein